MAHRTNTGRTGQQPPPQSHWHRTFFFLPAKFKLLNQIALIQHAAMLILYVLNRVRRLKQAAR